VVVSLDAGGDIGLTPTIEERTQEMETFTGTYKGHMRGTYRFLQALFRDEVGKNTSPLPYFALLNSAKCSGDDGKMDKVPFTLHKRCQPFLLEEMKALQPQLIWLQGKDICSVLKPVLGHISEPDNELRGVLERFGCNHTRVIEWVRAFLHEYFLVVRIDNREIVAVKTVHPADRHGQWAQFERSAMPLIADVAVCLTQSRVAHPLSSR
jgi:hypothetical protein